MEGKCIAVCIVAGVLGLIAAVMGFAAEGTRIKADNVFYNLDDGTCIYPKSPSVALGIVAAIILLIEQILISGASGCFCCRGTSCPSSCSGITSVICFIFSWLVFIAAVVVLIFGAVLNSARVLENKYNNTNECGIGKFGLFIVAGVLCIISVALGLISYIVLISNDKKNISRGVNEHAAAVATAKPHMPTNV